MRRNPATEAAIGAAARDVLAKSGAAGFTIEAVARRAGERTIHRWWPTKADLLVEVYVSERAARIAEPDGGSLPGDLAALARGIWGCSSLGQMPIEMTHGAKGRCGRRGWPKNR